MKTLRVLDEARHEFADALRYYRRQAPAFAQALATEYRAIVRHAREFPDAGTREEVSASVPVRRFLLRQFPYKVVTAHLPDQVVVLAFAHHARRPGYWQGRIKKVH